MSDYRPQVHAIQLISDGPAPASTANSPCCAWCGWPIPEDCPSDYYDQYECQVRWQTWRAGPVPDSPPDYPWKYHVGGVPWDEAPIPDRVHHCAPWSSRVANQEQRCACGAVRFWEGAWMGVDSRRWRQAA